MDFHTMSSQALAEGIRHQRFSAEAVMDHFLARIHRLNPTLNAVVVLREDQARQQARAADEAVRQGRETGPLHGVPMTIKETFEVAGWPTTAGHEPLRERISPLTAPAVQRLMDAGAIVIGKTNVPELAGDLQTFNNLYGTTSNPWDTALTPGGSSGGAAAALASGLVPLELGSDIGGSIRTPAAFCGVYGLKTTYGVVPTRGHIPGPPGTLAKRDLGVAGPMARHLEDLALALELIAGPDEDMATAWQLRLPEATTGTLADLRVAAWLEDTEFPVDGAITSALVDLVARLRRAGAQVDEQARPGKLTLKDNHELYYSLLTAVMGSGLSNQLFQKMAELARNSQGQDYRSRFARGATQTHAHWQQLNEQRAQLQAQWRRFFESFDLLICPVANTLAFPHNQDTPAPERTLTINGHSVPYMDVTAWAGVATLAGLPALTLPLGLTPAGLPVAAQLIGPAYSEKQLLRIGRQLARDLHPSGLPWPGLS